MLCLIPPLDQVHAERANKERGIAFALRDIARDLGGVHRLLRGHIFEISDIIPNGKPERRQHCEADFKEAPASANFQLMNQVLQNCHKSKPFQMMLMQATMKAAATHPQLFGGQCAVSVCVFQGLDDEFFLGFFDGQISAD